MNIPGYDAWKLSGPPEWEGPTCDYCGAGGDVRVESEGCGRVKPSLVCEDCFTGQDDGPCFDDLQTAEDYAGEREDLRADYLMDQARDREWEAKEGIEG